MSEVVGIGLAGGQGVRARPLTLKAPGYLRSKGAQPVNLDEFGSMNADVAIPTGGATGGYSLNLTKTVPAPPPPPGAPAGTSTATSATPAGS